MEVLRSERVEKCEKGERGLVGFEEECTYR